MEVDSLNVVKYAVVGALVTAVITISFRMRAWPLKVVVSEKAVFTP